MEDKEYTQANAARFLGVSPQRVLQWRNEKRLVGYFHDNRWFVSQQELAEFLARPRRGSGRPKKNV